MNTVAPSASYVPPRSRRASHASSAPSSALTASETSDASSGTSAEDGRVRLWSANALDGTWETQAQLVGE